MAAVAAPSPDADPVITTHKPSLAICISSACSDADAIYHNAVALVYNAAQVRFAELNCVAPTYHAATAGPSAASPLVFLPPFPHHECKKSGSAHARHSLPNEMR
jgi:hypothetical protein